MERPNRFTKPVARPKGWTEEEKQRLARLAKQGVAASEIAATLGRHTTSVRRMARDMKLLLRKEAAT
jgi:transposase-like protein